MICQKCGFDHNDPGSELGAIEVLACVLTRSRYKFEVVTRYGPKRPMTVIPLDRKRSRKK